MRYPTAKNKGRLDLTCSTTYPGTTLFVTRYEYVNLFHTLTDWWNAFFVLPRRNGMNGGGNDNDNDNDDTFARPEQIVRPDRVIFLDGHPRGLLDPVWETVFGEYHFVKHLDDGTSHGGGICFERAVFVPPGYHSPLYNDYRRKQCPHRGMARAFSDFVLDRYGLLHSSSSRASTPGLFGGLLSSSSNTPPVTKPGSVVIVDRQPFVSHPRSDPNAMARKFDDAELTKLRRKLSTVNGVESVRLVRFETLSFGEQLRLLRETDVLIGIHGAALSHMLFMDETKSQTIEFQPESQLDFFEYLSEWKGMDHKIIELDYVTDALTDRGIQEAVRAVETHLSTTTNNHR
jgi:glycoprotein 2-beta-D-xylosyltransferase